MSFWDEFSSCMNGSGLPTPAQALDSAGEVMEFLERLHQAAEDAGAIEVTLATLEATGAIGLAGPYVADAAAVTASAYAGAVAGCLVAASGSSIYDWLSQIELSAEVRQQITVAANDAGLEPDQANA